MLDSEIIGLALDKYLGTPQQWCRGAWSRDRHNIALHRVGDFRAVSHCCEGAIRAAVMTTLPAHQMPKVHQLTAELVAVFGAQYPDLEIEDIEPCSSTPFLRSARSIPDFNDNDLMTYEGVRSALEKFKALLEEEGR